MRTQFYSHYKIIPILPKIVTDLCRKNAANPFVRDKIKGLTHFFPFLVSQLLKTPLKITPYLNFSTVCKYEWCKVTQDRHLTHDVTFFRGPEPGFKVALSLRSAVLALRLRRSRKVVVQLLPRTAQQLHLRPGPRVIGRKSSSLGRCIVWKFMDALPVCLGWIIVE